MLSNSKLIDLTINTIVSLIENLQDRDLVRVKLINIINQLLNIIILSLKQIKH